MSQTGAIESKTNALGAYDNQYNASYQNRRESERERERQKEKDRERVLRLKVSSNNALVIKSLLFG